MERPPRWTREEFETWPLIGKVAFDGQPIRYQPDYGHAVWEDGHGPIGPIPYAVRMTRKLRLEAMRAAGLPLRSGETITG